MYKINFYFILSARLGDDARYMEILLAFHVKYEQKTTGPWSEKGFDW